MQCRFSVFYNVLFRFHTLSPLPSEGGQGGGIEAGYKKEIILTINKL